MKVRYTDAIASREGRVIDVTDAAGRRLIDEGLAEKIAAKAEPKADEQPTAKKATKKPAAKKSSR